MFGAFMDYEIVWVDPAIEKKARNAICKRKAVSMKNDLDGITVLTVSGKNVKPIDDLAHFKNLIKLLISMTEVSDISVLSGLTNLCVLHLEENQISNVTALSGLTNLVRLVLMNNRLRNVSGLSSLTNLKRLALDEGLSLQMEYSSAYVTMDVQYYESHKNPYDRGSVIEILHITGGGVGGDSINTKIDEIAKEYQSFMVIYRDPQNPECRVVAYPSTAYRYINLLIIANIYPSYGTDGDLYAFLYDKQLKKKLLLSTAMNNDAVTQNDFQIPFDIWIEENQMPNNKLTASGLIPAGFRMRADGTTEYYLISTTTHEHGSRWKSFFVYYDDILTVDDQGYSYLIPTEDLDSMMPPLSYKQAE